MLNANLIREIVRISKLDEFDGGELTQYIGWRTKLKTKQSSGMEHFHVSGMSTELIFKTEP